MKQVILERHIYYSLWENLIYCLVIFISLFLGTIFFETGTLAKLFSIFSGFIIGICLLFIFLKKGLIVDGFFYKGYYIFGLLINQTEIVSPKIKNFTIVKKKYRQKYQGSRREPNMEYFIYHYEFYFVDEQGKNKKPFLICQSDKSREKAKSFIEQNTKLNYIN